MRKDTTNALKIAYIVYKIVKNHSPVSVMATCTDCKLCFNAHAGEPSAKKVLAIHRKALHAAVEDGGIVA